MADKPNAGNEGQLQTKPRWEERGSRSGNGHGLVEFRVAYAGSLARSGHREEGREIDDEVTLLGLRSDMGGCWLQPVKSTMSKCHESGTGHERS